MSQLRVGIINVTGYAGIELARLLARHPGVELVSVTGRSAAGKPLAAVFPHLAELGLTVTAELDAVDLAFSAMPHMESAKEVVPLINQGVKVVDISADFRLTSAADYPEWYDFTHPAPELLGDAVYGLPELYRERIQKTALVANPGCFPTSAILALAPAVKAGLITGEIIVDSKSGVSGAGRSLSLKSHFAEASDDVQAYALEGHRHLPEIFQQLALVEPGFQPRVTFVPHLIPMTRGILSTSYAPLASGHAEITGAELAAIYADFYRDAPFVRVTDAPPHTKHTWGANHCLVYPTRDVRSGRLVVVSCLDNLVKGAAGQAVQNMNLMLGLPETAGLEGLAVFP
jgi:N-acetyl-gamma-glutamyl-phosphate reductase